MTTANCPHKSDTQHGWSTQTLREQRSRSPAQRQVILTGCCPKTGHLENSGSDALLLVDSDPPSAVSPSEGTSRMRVSSLVPDSVSESALDIRVSWVLTISDVSSWYWSIDTLLSVSKDLFGDRTLYSQLLKACNCTRTDDHGLDTDLTFCRAWNDEPRKGPRRFLAISLVLLEENGSCCLLPIGGLQFAQ